MDYTNADALMKLSQEEIEELYFNQYNEELNYPSIDMEREEGDIIYKIYIYGNHSKYLCRVFEDKESDFNLEEEEL